MARAFVALGSNLQQPMRQVRLALTELGALPQTWLIKTSALYRTAPLGYDDQPDFINAVAELDTRLEPLQLLHALLTIENRHGRQRPFPNAPRILDLDLLLYDDRVMASTELTLPHPRMSERGFVMLPLAEIAPGLRIPGHGSAIEIARRCRDQGVEKLNA